MKNTIKVILDSSKYMTQACFTQKHGNFIFGGSAKDGILNVAAKICVNYMSNRPGKICAIGLFFVTTRCTIAPLV